MPRQLPHGQLGAPPETLAQQAHLRAAIPVGGGGGVRV